jgi:hypothetical protein
LKCVLPRVGRLFDIGFLVCVTLGAFAVSARIGLIPLTTDDGVAVMFAPWTSASESLSRATEPGGRFVRFGGTSFITVVMPDDQAYADRVLSRGAWLVMDPKVLAACVDALSLGEPKS